MNGCGTLEERYCQGNPTVGPLREQPVSVKVKRYRAANFSQSTFLKTHIFLETLMCKVSRDSPFSRNQALKLGDDWYTRDWVTTGTLEISKIK
jgi:hypothetical protein